VPAVLLFSAARDLATAETRDLLVKTFFSKIKVLTFIFVFFAAFTMFKTKIKLACFLLF
jgi:hypothetical protein